MILAWCAQVIANLAVNWAPTLTRGLADHIKALISKAFSFRGCTRIRLLGPPRSESYDVTVYVVVKVLFETNALVKC